MKKLNQWLPFIVLFCLAGTDKPKHLTDAQTLVDNVSADHNAYQHKGCFIKWKGQDGAEQYENHTDCSDLLDLLLEHSYGVTKEKLKEWTGHTRPLAEHWHDAIVAGKGAKQIVNVTDAQAGDILAIKFPPGLPDTGHIMIVCGPAEAIAAKAPIEPDTRQWDVTIIDSTKSGHGPTDTRYKSDGTFNQGVGKGVIRIYTKEDGTIAGYCWSDGAASKFRSQSDRNLVIGRLDVSKSE